VARTDRTLTLGTAERGRLVAGARRFGVVLDARAIDRFVAYAELLGRWSTRMNLISCRSAGELVERHFLDSLAVSPYLGAARTIVDLGSGAGLPGLPLAIGAPSRRTILVESRRRRTSFLREVKRTLDLENLDVLELRAVAGGPPPNAGAPGAAIQADAVVCRAVWADDELLPVAAAWLRPGGVLLWMRARPKGEASGTEPSPVDARATSDPASGMVGDSSIEYAVGTGPLRRIEIFRRGASA
jgi:16S rRNA (guanine527-N7)-methyltransferase